VSVGIDIVVTTDWVVIMWPQPFYVLTFSKQ